MGILTNLLKKADQDKKLKKYGKQVKQKNIKNITNVQNESSGEEDQKPKSKKQRKMERNRSLKGKIKLTIIEQLDILKRKQENKERRKLEEESMQKCPSKKGLSLSDQLKIVKKKQLVTDELDEFRNILGSNVEADFFENDEEVEDIKITVPDVDSDEGDKRQKKSHFAIKINNFKRNTRTIDFDNSVNDSSQCKIQNLELISNNETLLKSADGLEHSSNFLELKPDKLTLSGKSKKANLNNFDLEEENVSLAQQNSETFDNKNVSNSFSICKRSNKSDELVTPSRKSKKAKLTNFDLEEENVVSLEQQNSETFDNKNVSNSSLNYKSSKKLEHEYPNCDNENINQRMDEDETKDNTVIVLPHKSIGESAKLEQKTEKSASIEVKKIKSRKNKISETENLKSDEEFESKFYDYGKSSIIVKKLDDFEVFRTKPSEHIKESSSGKKTKSKRKSAKEKLSENVNKINDLQSCKSSNNKNDDSLESKKSKKFKHNTKSDEELKNKQNNFSQKLNSNQLDLTLQKCKTAKKTDKRHIDPGSLTGTKKLLTTHSSHSEDHFQTASPEYILGGIASLIHGKPSEQYSMSVVESEWQNPEARKRKGSKLKVDNMDTSETKRDYDPKNMIYVGNVSVKTTGKHLRQLFSKYGTIKSVFIARGKPKRTSTYALITFSSHDETIDSLEATCSILKDKHIFVDLAESRDKVKRKFGVFVSNIPFETEEETLYEEFKSCGNITHIRVVRDKNTGMAVGFAYIHFDMYEAKRKAMEMTDIQIGKRIIRICSSKSKKASDKVLPKKLAKKNNLLKSQMHTKKILERKSKKLIERSMGPTGSKSGKHHTKESKFQFQGETFNDYMKGGHGYKNLKLSKDKLKIIQLVAPKVIAGDIIKKRKK